MSVNTIVIPGGNTSVSGTTLDISALYGAVQFIPAVGDELVLKNITFSSAYSSHDYDNVTDIESIMAFTDNQDTYDIYIENITFTEAMYNAMSSAEGLSLEVTDISPDLVYEGWLAIKAELVSLPEKTVGLDGVRFLRDKIKAKQDTLTAGTGINISAQNVISATGGGINHLFYLTESFEKNSGIGYNIPVYKDRACTQLATYAEVYDAINDGGASFVEESGSLQSTLWQDVWETDGSQFCNDSDEGDNAIWVTHFGRMIKLTPENTGSGDNYPNNSAYFTAEVMGDFAVDPSTAYMKSNDNGTYSFYKNYTTNNNVYSFGELLYNFGYPHDVSERVQPYVERRAVQSSVHPNPYYGGLIISYVYSSNHNEKELRATFIKKVNGVETFVLCDITAQNDQDTEFTVTEIPFDQAMTGATSGAAGSAGIVPAPAAGDQEKVLHGDGTWKDTTAKLVEMSYGESNAWTKFINAYNAGSIVYCRASSNANPASGSQTRKAFMAYVNNAANPTSVEFQYVRSVSSKTEAQPVDQVFVYTLTNTNGGTWSVASRNMGPKIAAGTGINVSYSNGTYTISLA